MMQWFIGSKMLRGLLNMLQTRDLYKSSKIFSVYISFLHLAFCLQSVKKHSTFSFLSCFESIFQEIHASVNKIIRFQRTSILKVFAFLCYNILCPDNKRYFQLTNFHLWFCVVVRSKQLQQLRHYGNLRDRERPKQTADWRTGGRR